MTYTFTKINIRKILQYKQFTSDLKNNSFDTSVITNIKPLNDNDIEIVCDRDLTIEEQNIVENVLDSIILDMKKRNKKAAIDQKTRKFIEQGFLFDGVVFSLSDKAQFNWNALQASVANGLLTEADFPYDVTTKDDNTYSIQWNDFLSFIGTGLVTVSTHMASGRSLKKQVLEATTSEEVDAIVDDR